MIAFKFYKSKKFRIPQFTKTNFNMKTCQKFQISVEKIFK
jgi:hypothetical protein